MEVDGTCVYVTAQEGRGRVLACGVYPGIVHDASTELKRSLHLEGFAQFQSHFHLRCM